MGQLQCGLVALTQWPQAPTQNRKNGTFIVGYNTLMDDLNAELDYLDAKVITLQLYVPKSRLSQVRNSTTGWPKPETKTSEPGVILSFESRLRGALQFVCDTYQNVPGRQVGWQDNLRAITLTLSALRAVNRYGATQSEQQYKGFAALPPAAPIVEGAVTPSTAALCLAMYSGLVKDYILESPETFQKAYREAAKQAHPDRGGSNERMAAINEAAAVLRDYHKSGTSGRRHKSGTSKQSAW